MVAKRGKQDHESALRPQFILRLNLLRCLRDEYSKLLSGILTNLKLRIASRIYLSQNL